PQNPTLPSPDPVLLAPPSFARHPPPAGLPKPGGLRPELREEQPNQRPGASSLSGHASARSARSEQEQPVAGGQSVASWSLELRLASGVRTRSTYNFCVAPSLIPPVLWPATEAQRSANPPA
ncbi:Small nuclear RNA activating complex (SNAPc) subunit SNAP43 protein, partial [Zea mays]